MYGYLGRPAWTARTDAVQTFSRFCAPTVLAALMGVPRAEAAALLLATPGMPHRSTGSVGTFAWRQFLINDLGGARVHRDDIYDAATGQRGDPTVAMFCRAFPRGTYVLSTSGHTLLVEDGEVLADSVPTKSKRARVNWAVRMPAPAEGLVPDDEAHLEARRAHHERYKRARAERRAEARRRRQELAENPHLAVDRLFRF